ncbi:hypothetical protein G7046_g130 [Stylonectria norvegica]|nr:hypothetical protein G7046_g130 [Stylonectria norvegica]
MEPIRKPALMKPPLLEFPSVEEFFLRHDTATEEEWIWETDQPKSFNSTEVLFTAHIIDAPTKDDPKKDYVLRFSVHTKLELFPDVGDICKICLKMRGSTETSQWHNAERTQDHVRQGTDRAVQEFHVSPFPSDWSEWPWKVHVVPNSSKPVLINVMLRISKTTYNAKKAALHELYPSGPRRHILDYFVTFSSPTDGTGETPSTLYDHMFDRSQIADEKLRSAADRALSFFNPHQGRLYLWVPGAGKTMWALTTAAVAQMAPTKVRVLFILDINKPADDTAARMVKMYKALGMSKKVIRMHGWPKEIRKSKGGLDQKNVKTSTEDPNESLNRNPDFSSGFIEQFLSQEPAQHRSTPPRDRVLTLDETAWDYLQNHPDKEFAASVGKLITSQLNKQKFMKDHMPKMNEFRNTLLKLYEEALQDVDFIATTCVAGAQEYFRRAFKPDIIFFDEAGHAKELATLIPIAFFNAKAYIFLGDPAQAAPFVCSKATYSEQLKITALERATKAGIGHKFLINHRAYGGLHELPSALFYQNAMISNYKSKKELFTPPVLRVKQFLDNIRGREADITRVLVSLPGSSNFQIGGNSRWHQGHQDWIIRRIQELLASSWFTSIDGTHPGTILLITPTKESFNRYLTDLRSWEHGKRQRVELRTIGTAQASEADIVFVDIVKPTKFTNDKKRLCVALTRAIQGEIILLDSPPWQNTPRYLRTIPSNLRSNLPEFGNLTYLWDSCQVSQESQKPYQPKFITDIPQDEPPRLGGATA